MNNKINVSENATNFNTTIIGPSQSGKTNLGKQLQTFGYYYLDVNSLEKVDININIIKETFKLDSYLVETDKQNLILANIINLINKGTKQIIFDDVLTFIDINVRKKVITYLKEKNIKFINITMDIEDVLLGEYLVVMFDNKVALEGKVLDVLKEEKILKRLGLSLPFMVDISIQLKYYNLVDKIYLDENELVEKLWK